MKKTNGQSLAFVFKNVSCRYISDYPHSAALLQQCLKYCAASLLSFKGRPIIKGLKALC